MGVLNTVRSGLNVLFTPVLYGVVASLALQLTTWEKGDRTQDKLQDKGDPLLNKQDTFDFIIIGAGTAGSVLANRLSGSAERYSVLLLEAGGEPNPLVYVPGLASHLLNRPEVDWMYKTVAQKKGSALAQFKRTSLSAGKGLGGSGNLDSMIHLRGSPKDYDNWARLTKDSEWEYKNFIKYFRIHENFLGNTTDPEAHSIGGELTIQLPDYRPLAQEFVWAAKELGYANVDLNGRFSEGFDQIFYASKRGEKQTTYKTFVEPIKRRDNLTIRKFATVTKLLLRKTDTGAYGVEYERHGSKYTVYSKREIILSAGSIQSPKILLLSGIGPKKHLEDMGIKPVLDLPTGRNLQDHVAVPLGPFFIKEPLSFQFDRDVTAKTFFEYGTYGQGPLTTTGYVAAGLTSSSFAKLRGEKGWPDLNFLLSSASVHAGYAADMAHALGLQEGTLKKYYKNAVGKHSFHIVVSLGRPYARGEVRLASRDPKAPHVIDPKYFEDPWGFDIKTMVEGVKKAIDLVESTQPFKGIGGRFTDDVLPGCEGVQFRSDAYWECYVKMFSVSLHNPVGTCTMGPLDSPHAVVDSQLKVIGASGLRVIDASVMPSIVSAGTQPATIAIAEKGAESILLHWRTKDKEIKDREKKYFSESSEYITVKQPTPSPVSPSPPSLFAPQSTTSKEFDFFKSFGLSKEILTMPTLFPPVASSTSREIGFLKNFGLQSSKESSASLQQNWQNTLDSLAQFSKTIQNTFGKPPAPTITTTSSTTPATTTTTMRTTTRTTPKPAPVQTSLFQVETRRPLHHHIQNLIVYHDDNLDKHKSHTTPKIRIPSSTPSPKPHFSFNPSSSPRPSFFVSSTPRPIPMPYVPSPTQVVVTPSSSRSTPLTATTFRPIGFNSSEAFSVNLPNVKGGQKHIHFPSKTLISSHRSPVKTYNLAPSPPPKSILRKPPQSRNPPPKTIYVLPPPSPTPSRVPTAAKSTKKPTRTTTTTSTTPLPVTTRRPVFELIQREVLPSNYDNLVDMPISVEYLTLPDSVFSSERDTTTTPSTTTTTTTTTPRPRPIPTRTPSSFKMPLPAIQIEKNPLETTTTRIMVTSPFQTLIQSNRIQSVPQDVFLRGLETMHLIDVTTATEHPQPTPGTLLPAVPLLLQQQQKQQQQHQQQLNQQFFQQQNQLQVPVLEEIPLMHEQHLHQTRKQKKKQKQFQFDVTSQSPSSVSTSTNDSPIFYVVRKKQRQESNHHQQPRPQQQQQQTHVMMRPNHSSEQQRRPQVRQRRPQQHRHQQRQQPQVMVTAKAHHFPVYALPESQSHLQFHHSPTRRHYQHRPRQRSRPRPQQHIDIDHMQTSSSELQAQTTRPRVRRVRTRVKVASSGPAGDALDGVITPAISGPMFQQNVLNQLIPVIE